MEEANTPLAPYYDALEAEVALAQGESLLAWQLATRALEHLPEGHSLFRARVAAIGAVAATDTGRNREALALYEEALLKDGGVIRRLGLRIPARVRVTGGGDIGARAADLLEASPRFRADAGFEIAVTGDGREVTACLRTPHAAEIGCTSVDPVSLSEEWRAAHEAWQEELENARETDEDIDPLLERQPEEPDPAERVAELFHERIFSAPVTLSSADLSSLDGRTTTGAEVAREQFRTLLEQTTPPP
jgi:tetratricopeptide (TPR) repeat protein